MDALGARRPRRTARRLVVHQRPAAGGLRGPERGQAPGSRPVVLRRPLPAQRAERCEGVVRDLPRPDQVPERVERLAVRPGLRCTEQLAVEAGAAAAEMGAQPLVEPSGGSLHAVGRATGAQQLPAGSEEHHAAVVAAEAPPPHPGDLAHGAQLVEEPGLVAGDTRRQHVPLQDRRRDRQARELVHDLREAFQRSGATERGTGTPRRGGRRGHALPRGQEPGQGDGVDGFHLPSERREGSPAQQPEHLRVAELPLRAARSELARQQGPAATSRWSASSTTPAGSPQRRAGSDPRNGPCVRAYRARSPSSAPVTGARKACGTPGGALTPTPSR